MNDPYCYKNAIAKSASIMKGDVLRDINTLIDKQKTISTKKLSLIVSKIQEDNMLTGIFISQMAKKIEPLSLLHNKPATSVARLVEALEYISKKSKEALEAEKALQTLEIEDFQRRKKATQIIYGYAEHMIQASDAALATYRNEGEK